MATFSATVKEGSKWGWVKRYPNEVSLSFPEPGPDISVASSSNKKTRPLSGLSIRPRILKSSSFAAISEPQKPVMSPLSNEAEKSSIRPCLMALAVDRRQWMFSQRRGLMELSRTLTLESSRHQYRKQRR
jgi:hypothetical protein